MLKNTSKATEIFLIAGGLLWLMPYPSYAAVIINEIAWMGTTNSANDEWVELYNSGSSAVSLADWRLSDGINFNVTLTDANTLAAGAYAVLERTDESSAPGTAFYIYTGSLPNTGATLKLYDATGALVDQVAGGENWELIGGDNTTKETAQYSSTGWQTAAATPGTATVGATNGVADTTSIEADTTDTQTVSSVVSYTSGSSNKTSTSPVTIRLELPKRVFVGQSVLFESVVSGGTKWQRGGQDTVWNFGDGTMSTERRPEHIYQYPGTYIVALESTYDDETTLLTQEVIVLPMNLSLSALSSGELQITNDAVYDVEVSGMQVKTQDETYTFPPHSFIKARGAVTLSLQLVPTTSGAVVALYDTENSVVAFNQLGRTAGGISTPTVQPAAARTVAATAPATRVASVASPIVETTPPIRVAGTSTSQPLTSQTATLINALPEAAPPRSAAIEVTNLRWLSLAGVGLLVLLVIGLLARRVPAYRYDT